MRRVRNGVNKVGNLRGNRRVWVCACVCVYILCALENEVRTGNRDFA